MKTRLGLIIIILIFSCTLVGCSGGYRLAFEIPNYDGFLKDLPYLSSEPLPPTPPQEQDPPHGSFPSVIGFSLLAEGYFDMPAFFGANAYAVTSVEGSRKLIDKSGGVFDMPEDLKEIIGDKYLFTDDNGNIGVKNIDGEVLLEARFLSVNLIGGTVLASDATSFYVFENNDRLVSVCRNSVNLSLYSETALIKDGVLCDLTLAPISFGGYYAVGILGFVAMIKNERELLGFYDIEGGRLLIEPQYVEASYFANGYAVVRKTANGDYLLIDTMGKECAAFARRPFGFYDGYLMIDNGTGGVDLYDGEFAFTGLSFREVYANRVYNGFVIDKFAGRLFSISQNQYVTDMFEEIVPTDFGFICKSDNSAVLLSHEGEKFFECDDAYFDGGILSVKTENSYCYFACNKEN